jgi:pyrroline-5-carboxylate reductase
MRTIGFIGSGNIAEALVKGFSTLEQKPRVLVLDAVPGKAAEFAARHGAEDAQDLANLLTECGRNEGFVFMAVKPQSMKALLSELAAQGEASRAPLYVSVVTGWTLAAIGSALTGARVIRVMPNTPVAVGAGMMALAASDAVSAAEVAEVEALLKASGRVERVPEGLFDAVTGLSGSGPAYGFLMIEALADGGVYKGLPRQLAYTLAAQTLLGAAKMVLETGKHPGELKDMVTSPAGTTIAGVKALEDRGFRAACVAAVAAASERAAELGKGA